MKSYRFDKKIIFHMFTVLLVVFSMLAQVTPARAVGVTITVNTIGDSSLAVCPGTCTLRAAIADNIAQGASNTINFNPGLTEIILDTELVIANPVTITGPAMLKGNGVRVFNVTAGTVTLNNLTIRNTQFGGTGAAILNAGALTVNNSTFSGNATLTAAGKGGAIYNTGTLTVNNSTFSANTASAGGNGGAIYNTGTLIVKNSTFTGNSTSGYGGAINNSNAAVTAVTVWNSTFSTNSATGYGGGIYSSAGTLTVYNSTFSANSTASFGAGIYNVGALVFSNTIIANSTAVNYDCYNSGTLGINLNNIVETSVACGTLGVPPLLVTTDPMLGPLADNAVPPSQALPITQTMALLSGSPAIDAGDAGVCATVLNFDQRGVTRVGANAPCDIGAYEAVVYTLTVNTTGSTGSGTVTSSPAGINCGATCAAPIISGTVVTLTAVPAAGSVLSSWAVTGGVTPPTCPGTGTCTVTMDVARTVTAVFATSVTLAVGKSGAGSGTVTSSPAGISCGATCLANFALTTPATVVTLTAVADAGSTFTGWSGGGCSGTGTCAVTMDATKLVTANFSGSSAGTFTLTVTKAGTGTGTVTSAPAGIGCGVTCAFAFNSGTSVTLTAATGAGSTFTGWSGAGCSGTGTCVVTMSAAQSVTATFSSFSNTLTVVKTGAGTGTVTSAPAGIACGATCSFTFAAGTVVTLTAAPDAGITFTGWSGGGCSGTGTCVVTMSTAQTVIATFGAATANNLTVTKAGTGTGTVTSAPVGIACGSVCLYPFTVGTSVTLTAVPDAGSTFSGWSGAGCAGTGTCVVTMSVAQSVTAIFGISGTSTFGDVPTTHPQYKYIQALWNNGYTAGCSVNPLMFCPDTILDRAQSAVFMLRGQFGGGYIPPAAPWNTFLADSWVGFEWAQPWAEGMYKAGLTQGCQTSPLKFCPVTQLPRVEASVFGLKMKYGSSYTPPAATGTVFADFPSTNSSYWGIAWAEKAYADGLLPACGTDSGTGKPMFCPGELVNRGWGAYLIVKAKGLPTP